MKFEQEDLGNGKVRVWFKYPEPVGINMKDWKITTRVANIDPEKDRRTLRGNERLRVDQRDIIDCLKRNFALAATYYETGEYGLMQSSPSGMELARIMRHDLGYSEKSSWWDIVHKRLDLYRIARKEMSWYKFKTPQIEQILDFLDAQDNEKNLTRGTTKGLSMNNGPIRADYAPSDIRNATCESEKPMDLKRHKQITDLAYKLKAAIDKELGKEPLKYNEVCMLGEIMQRIIPLK